MHKMLNKKTVQPLAKATGFPHSARTLIRWLPRITNLFQIQTNWGRKTAGVRHISGLLGIQNHQQPPSRNAGILLCLRDYANGNRLFNSGGISTGIVPKANTNPHKLSSRITSTEIMEDPPRSFPQPAQESFTTTRCGTKPPKNLSIG